MYNISQLQDIINTELTNINFVQEPNNLYEPIEYTMSIGGKRIRPLLCLLSTQLFGGNVTNAIKPALGVEIFHNFTLLHDDIMDNAEVRRNKPTVHKKWNENVGILSGDAMLIRAYQFVENCEARVLPAVLKLFNETALGVCEGQQYDMDFEIRSDVSEEEYLEMIRLKTAILLAASLKLGALLADCSEEDGNNIYQFGINIGIAFQLQDDFLDTFGDQNTFGKKIGGDIISNKKTFLLINALKDSSPQDKEKLLQWISQKEFNADEKISAVKKIYLNSGVNTKSQKLMDQYFTQATDYLNKVNGEDFIKNELSSLATKLMKRNN